MKSLKVLIFDEADQIIDMGFKREIDEIVSRINHDRRTFLFSATISEPIKKIANSYLQHGFKHIDTVPENETDTHLSIKQSSLVVPYKDQIAIMHHILKEHKKEFPAYKVIVFFQTTKMVTTMTRIFQELNMDVMELQSKMEQVKRSKIYSRFRSARNAILFTTDISARGVDYPDVTLVLSFGMPSSRDQYIHRVGRTGFLKLIKRSCWKRR
jgi:ATP-dependent RNA helicase MSS116